MEKVTTDVVKALIANGDEVREVFLQKEVRLALCDALDGADGFAR
jgi:hypothetical protein